MPNKQESPAACMPPRSLSTPFLTESGVSGNTDSNDLLYGIHFHCGYCQSRANVVHPVQ